MWRFKPSVSFRIGRSAKLKENSNPHQHTYYSVYHSDILFFFLFFFFCSPGVAVDSYSCLDPGIPVNGIRYGQDFSIGSTVSFGCDSGYRLSHEEPLVCEKNHWWSHPLPTCDGKYLVLRTFCATQHCRVPCVCIYRHDMTQGQVNLCADILFVVQKSVVTK